MIAPGEAARNAERAKYVHVYRAMETYHMGAQRELDARLDVRWMYKHGARDYLEIGCGRGEMLRYASKLGFDPVFGTEIVPDLCGHNVWQCAVHDLHAIPTDNFDACASFDVLEHLLPDDDALLIAEMGRIARTHIAMTANNKPSIDPTSGNNLHVNIRTYPEWHQLIEFTLGDNWKVERVASAYVSETWRATR